MPSGGRVGEESKQTRSDGTHGTRLSAGLHHLLELSLSIGAAFVISVDVCDAEGQGHEDDDEPLNVELEQADEKQAEPEQGRDVKDGPEDGRIELVDDLVVSGAFEDPLGAIAFDLVPPSQANEQPSGDVLHDPEIGRQGEDAADGERDELGSRRVTGGILGEEAAEDVKEERDALEVTAWAARSSTW